MNLLKRYLFWTYQRGSFHYDVMVTIILLFIFVSPHVIDFGEKPVPDKRVEDHEVLVESSGPSGLVYELSSSGIARTADTALLHRELASGIESIAGPVTVDRYEVTTDASGHIAGYRVYAHRADENRVP